MNLNKKKVVKKEKTKNFTQRIYDKGMVPNVVAGVVSVVYIILTTNVHVSLRTVLQLIVIGVSICLVLQYLFAPITNKLITKQMNDELEEYEKYETTVRERTRLLKKVMAIPLTVGIQVFIMFGMGTTFFVSTFDWLFHLQLESMRLSYIAGIMGAFAGFILAVNESQKVCSEYACKIIKSGIDKNEIKEKHSFGLSSLFYVVVDLLIPSILVNVVFALIAFRTYYFKTAFSVSYVVRTVLIALFNVIYAVYFSRMIFMRMMKSIELMKTTLESMDGNHLDEVQTVGTDLSNEFMFNIYLVNEIIETLQKILKSGAVISGNVIESSNELSVVSKETAVTSLEQSTGIKELLSAMEESDNLAKNVSSKTNEVSLVAKKTYDDISSGFEILKDNMQKLTEINQANEITYDGIKVLSKKISGISDIASIINAFADQTNIIAFNAELEASSASDTEKNFSLVANEIRRLTNSTIDSTKEIKTRIFEIQQASEQLLTTSKEASKKISEGNKIVTELDENFNNLKLSSQETESSTGEIKKIIEQQTYSFEQIVITLRQILAAAENFSTSTQTVSQSAENLCTLADQLKTIKADEITSLAGDE